MKIIIKDNFDRDYISDTLVCENVNEYFGSKIVKLLNEREHNGSPNYFTLVSDDYILFDVNDLY